MTLEEKRASRAKANKKWRAAHPEQMRAIKRANYHAHPERNRVNRLLKAGLSPAQYDAMLVTQEGHCGACPATTPGGKGAWHVDHDHKTGKIRGLLCHHCNTALGLVKDNPATLFALIHYLLRITG